MGQRLQQWHSGSDDRDWLFALVDTFEKTVELRNSACDRKLRSEVEARLARPALPCGRELHREIQHWSLAGAELSRSRCRELGFEEEAATSVLLGALAVEMAVGRCRKGE